jgi:hypothetical protein
MAGRGKIRIGLSLYVTSVYDDCRWLSKNPEKGRLKASKNATKSGKGQF